MSDPHFPGTSPTGLPQAATPLFPGPEVSPKSSRGILTFLLGAASGAIVVGLTWAAFALLPGLTTPPADNFSLKGSLTLTSTSLSGVNSGSECYGTGGYNDIGKGAAVTVYGASGQVLAVGSLVSGQQGTGSLSCVFAFTVPDVPVGEKFYQVEVSHRGKVTVQADQARTTGVFVTLGN
ncbi:hypothetical protein [Kutzneria albida]|uniref:Putative membrane protein n=1 Tax=Kutzneria albida DSM 43870 TaxID=1449976 RepID=W5W6B9_9PSEU|nr:hypothetical protein [Kutzneria albida]AHH93724.1 putative membrane protein [Kutzneria albida DSM 43870]